MSLVITIEKWRYHSNFPYKQENNMRRDDNHYKQWERWQTIKKKLATYTSTQLKLRSTQQYNVYSNERYETSSRSIYTWHNKNYRIITKNHRKFDFLCDKCMQLDWFFNL